MQNTRGRQRITPVFVVITDNFGLEVGVIEVDEMLEKMVDCHQHGEDTESQGRFVAEGVEIVDAVEIACYYAVLRILIEITHLDIEL